MTKDFFISYNQADRNVAAWIDQQLRAAGYSTTFQLTDMPPGSAFVHEMDKAIEENTGLIAVLSPDYLKAPHCKAEWQAFYQKDPNGEQRALIPVRVRECKPKGLLSQRVYIDLVGKTGEEAEKTLLAGVKAAREKLELQARYPLDDLLNRYFDQLRQKVSTVRIFGDAEAHPLDQVFVELTINEEYDRRPNQAEFLGLMDAELRRMRSVFGDAEQYRDREGADDLDQRAFAKTKRTIKPDDLLRRHTHAVVTGAPGCGKTTLLRYLTWQTLKAWRAFGVPPSGGSTHTQAPPPEGGTPNVDPNARFPVFLELKQLTATAFQQAQGQLEELLFAVGIAATLKPSQAESETLKDYFFNLLRAGRVAIFLDGLDEVSGASFFRELQTATQAFLQSVYGGNTVIISTRPFALPRFADAQEMEILPLNPRQIEQFIEHYYRDVPERQQFQRELQRRRELRELARVPALLGFILQLWRKHGSVTDDKLELYEQITHELAQQLDREKEGIAPEREWLVEDKDGSLKLDLLRQLAFNQLFKGLIHPPYEIGGSTNDVDRLVFTSEQLRAEAAEFARTLKKREGTKIKPRKLAEDVKATALLRQVGDDHYAFAHLTLQEYLAAWQLAKRDNGDICERIFCRAYFNPTLAEMEVLPMTLGLVDKPDKLYEALEQLPESLDFKELRLRARGLGYGATVKKSLTLRLIERLSEFIRHTNPDEKPYHWYVVDSFAAVRGESQSLVDGEVGTLLKDKNSNLQNRAAWALKKIGGERAVPALLEAALKDETYAVRVSAASALGEIGGEKAMASLLAALHDEDSEVRWSAAFGLGQIGSERAVAALSDVLHDNDSQVRETAAEALGMIGGEQAIEVLIEALKRGDRVVRVRAAQALGEIGGEQAVAPLLDALRDEDSNVRNSVKWALKKTGGEQAMEARLNAPQCEGSGLQEIEANGLEEVGGEQKVAKTISEISDEQAEAALIEALKNVDSEVRERAAKALGKVGSRQAVETLLAALHSLYSGDWSIVERWNEMTLGRTLNDGVGGKWPVYRIIDLFLDEDSNVRRNAAQALERIGAKGELAGGVMLALDSSNALVRRKAASIIGYYTDDERLLPKLARLVSADSVAEVREEACESLRKFERKLQYFDIPIPIITTNDPSPPSPPPPLTVQEQIESE